MLEERVAELAEAFPEETGPPRPPRWGGYRIRPEVVELWEEGADRLHDRLRYQVAVRKLEDRAVITLTTLIGVRSDRLTGRTRERGRSTSWVRFSPSSAWGVVLGILVWQEGGAYVGLIIAVGAVALAAFVYWLVQRPPVRVTLRMRWTLPAPRQGVRSA